MSCEDGQNVTLQPNPDGALDGRLRPVPRPNQHRFGHHFPSHVSVCMSNPDRAQALRRLKGRSVVTTRALCRPQTPWLSNSFAPVISPSGPSGCTVPLRCDAVHDDARNEAAQPQRLRKNKHQDHRHKNAVLFGIRADACISDGADGESCRKASQTHSSTRTEVHVPVGRK